MAQKLFYCRLRPTRDLLASLGTEKYWVQCSQIMRQVTMLHDCIGATIAQLAYACLPWEEYCTMLAGLPSFGHDGHPGYCSDGPYRICRHRRAGFWAKECVLDLRSIVGVFQEAYTPSDRNTFTPMEWGAVDFIATQMDVHDISEDEALAVLQRVHGMQQRFGWHSKGLELADLDRNCSEARKFCIPQATVLRATMRERYRAEEPEKFLNSPSMRQPDPPLPAPELPPHRMERVPGRTGGWICVVCHRTAQRKDGLSGPGCAGRRETAVQARLRTLGMTPRKRKQ